MKGNLLNEVWDRPAFHSYREIPLHFSFCINILSSFNSWKSQKPLFLLFLSCFYLLGLSMIWGSGPNHSEFRGWNEMRRCWGQAQGLSWFTAWRSAGSEGPTTVSKNSGWALQVGLAVRPKAGEGQSIGSMPTFQTALSGCWGGDNRWDIHRLVQQMTEGTSHFASWSFSLRMPGKPRVFWQLVTGSTSRKDVAVSQRLCF